MKQAAQKNFLSAHTVTKSTKGSNEKCSYNNKYFRFLEDYKRLFMSSNLNSFTSYSTLPFDTQFNHFIKILLIPSTTCNLIKYSTFPINFISAGFTANYKSIKMSDVPESTVEIPEHVTSSTVSDLTKRKYPDGGYGKVLMILR